MKQSNLPAPAANTIRALLDKSREQLQAALPKHLSADRLMRVAMTGIQKSPKLLDCTPMSLLKSIMEAAQLGLEPDGVLGQAYLVPFWNKRTNALEAQFMIGYRGLISLARRSGELLSIGAEVVRENDHFTFRQGLNEELEHIPNLTAGRGAMIAVYAIARFKDGGHAFKVLSRQDVDKVRSSSKAADDGPWVTHEEEMWKKTVTKALCKWLPLSIELHTLLAEEGLKEAGVTMDISPVENKTLAKTEDLKARLEAAKAPVNAEVEEEANVESE